MPTSKQVLAPLLCGAQDDVDLLRRDIALGQTVEGRSYRHFIGMVVGAGHVLLLDAQFVADHPLGRPLSAAMSAAVSTGSGRYMPRLTMPTGMVSEFFTLFSNRTFVPEH